MKKTVFICGLFLILSLFAGCANADYEKTLENEIEETNSKYSSLVSEYNALMIERNELDASLAQSEADRDAYKEAYEEYKKICDEYRQSIEAEKTEELIYKEKWETLTEAQKNTIKEGKERAEVVNTLLYSNEEYSALYKYFLDLENSGVTSFITTSDEFAEYEANRARKKELEDECRRAMGIGD